jgi:nucleoid DNA-binding protein
MHLKDWVQATYHTLQNSPQTSEITQEQIRLILTSAVDVVCDELKRGGGLHLNRLGILRAVARKERQVNDNFSTGGSTKRIVPARRTVRFTASSLLLSHLNGATGDVVDDDREIGLPTRQPTPPRPNRSPELEV